MLELLRPGEDAEGCSIHVFLDEVEKGAVVTITRRGRPVAVLRQEESASRTVALEAVRRLRTLCTERASASEIVAMRDERRDR